MKTRILNIFIVFAIVIGFLPLNAFAIEEKTKTYVYDNFTVDYNITNEWSGTQNISISITNTGYDPIENWMLAYNFNGDIHDIWSAEVKENSDGVKYIKNLGYNNIIEPDSTIRFGYALYNAGGFPDDFSMCQKRVVKESGFDVNLEILDSWDESFKGEITIRNNTDTDIECWELSIDSNFTFIEITDSWAANIINYNDGTYTLKGTYTNVIYANSSVALGFMGIKSGDPEILSYTLTEVVADVINIPDEKEPDDSDDPYVHVDDMYYKPILSSDDVDYDGKGIYFVRNQVLVTAYQNVAFDEVKELAEKYNAEIVGYIWLTNDYQLEFKSDVSAEYLYKKIEEFINEPMIEYASLNIAFELAPDFTPTESDWTNVENANWHIEAIRAEDAWDYYDSMSEVKIGLIDQAFYYLHEDLNDNFSKGRIWGTPNNFVDYDILSHGTHVAGIMAAGFNNGIGISGICPKNSLYAYSVHPIAIGNDIPKDTSIMQFKIAFATLIANNVKVINISMNDNTEVNIGATHGNANALNYINTSSEIFGKFLQKIIDLEYDFLIVSAAGNTNDDEYIKDDNADYGFKFIDNDDNINDDDKLTGARAEYLSFWNYIGYETQKNSTEFKNVRDRIIVVGSINDKNIYSEFSNYGDRVDIVAPGEKILSTVNPSSAMYKDRNGNGYCFKKGTSMAAPQVAGVAGMIYSFKPGLKADKVKDIIIKSAEKSAQNDSTRQIEQGGCTNYILDAKAALDMASGENAGEIPDETNNAILYGTMLSTNDKPVSRPHLFAISQTNHYVKHFETDENGDYLISLPPDTYNLIFSGHDETIISDKQTFNSKTGWNDSTYVCHYTDGKKLEANTAYQLDVTLDNKHIRSVGIIDTYGRDLTDFEITIIDAANNKSYPTKINGSDFGYAYIEDGDYVITASTAGYVSQTLNVIAKDGILYDENENVLEKITLTPIPAESTITGAVLLYNKTTYDVTPIANHKVSIYRYDPDRSDVSSLICTTATNSEGIYKVKINEIGNIAVKFDEKKQNLIYLNGEENEYIANACYIITDEDDDEDEDEDNNGNDNGDNGGNNNGDNDTDNRQIGLPGILYKYFGKDEHQYYFKYYCSSITIIGPYPSGKYDVTAYYSKMIYKDAFTKPEEIIYGDAVIGYWSKFPDGRTLSADGGHKIIVGGTCFPLNKAVSSLSLPEEITEKLMSGDTIYIFDNDVIPE